MKYRCAKYFISVIPMPLSTSLDTARYDKFSLVSVASLSDNDINEYKTDVLHFIIRCVKYINRGVEIVHLPDNNCDIKSFIEWVRNYVPPSNPLFGSFDWMFIEAHKDHMCVNDIRKAFLLDDIRETLES